MKSIFKRTQRRFDVSVQVDFLGSKLNLSVPVSALTKSQAKKLAQEVVLKKINVSAHTVHKVNTK